MTRTLLAATALVCLAAVAAGTCGLGFSDTADPPGLLTTLALFGVGLLGAAWCAALAPDLR